MINTGDTAWVLASSALVLLMTIPGLALFYGGLVRSKNVLGTLMQSFIMVGLISLQWLIFDTVSPLPAETASSGVFSGWVCREWAPLQIPITRRRSRTRRT